MKNGRPTNPLETKFQVRTVALSHTAKICKICINRMFYEKSGFFHPDSVFGDGSLANPQNPAK